MEAVVLVLLSVLFLAAGALMPYLHSCMVGMTAYGVTIHHPWQSAGALFVGLALYVGVMSRLTGGMSWTKALMAAQRT